MKPHPDIYQRVLSQLQIQPHEALVFEDSPNGITAAKAAGIFCIVVPNPLTSQLPIGRADYRLASLADLPLQSLLAYVGRVRPSGGPIR